MDYRSLDIMDSIVSKFYFSQIYYSPCTDVTICNNEFLLSNYILLSQFSLFK